MSDCCVAGGRRKVRREIQRRPRQCRVMVGSSRLAARAEIHQHDPAAVFAHHVLGLDVAMDDAGAMTAEKRAAEIDADEQCFLRPERATLDEQMLERAAVNELHPQTDTAVDAVRPWIVTMFGWRTRASSRPSLMIVDRSNLGVGRRSFSATSRSSRGSHARYTSPNEPRPMCSSSSSGPHLAGSGMGQARIGAKADVPKLRCASASDETSRNWRIMPRSRPLA